MPTEVGAAQVLYSRDASLFVAEDASCDLSSSWRAYLTSSQLQLPRLSFSSSFLAKLFTEPFHDYLAYLTISY